LEEALGWIIVLGTPRYRGTVAKIKSRSEFSD